MKCQEARVAHRGSVQELRWGMEHILKCNKCFEWFLVRWLKSCERAMLILQESGAYTDEEVLSAIDHVATCPRCREEYVQYTLAVIREEIEDGRRREDSEDN